MSVLDSPRGGSAPATPANGVKRQLRHTRSQVTSYGTHAVKVNHPPARNLSPTRLPQADSDVALWGGFLRLLSLNGHSYGPGYWGGN